MTPPQRSTTRFPWRWAHQAAPTSPWLSKLAAKASCTGSKPAATEPPSWAWIISPKSVLPAGRTHSWRVGWEDLTPSDAAANAGWIGGQFHPLNAHDVGSVVPTGFASYARILHPASTREREVRWAEVAAWSGRGIHPEVHFHALVPSLPMDQIGTEPFVYPPTNGVLPESQVRALARLLSQHTTKKDRCWFCLWEGYGYLNEGGAAWVRAYYVGSWAGRWARWRDKYLRVSIRRPK